MARGMVRLRIADLLAERGDPRVAGEGEEEEAGGAQDPDVDVDRGQPIERGLTTRPPGGDDRDEGDDHDGEHTPW